MKTLQKKSLSIDAETHKKIAIASVETGRDMWELIRDAWQMFSGSGAPPVAHSHTDETAAQVMQWFDHPPNDSERAVRDLIAHYAGIHPSRIKR